MINISYADDLSMGLDGLCLSLSMTSFEIIYDLDDTDVLISQRNIVYMVIFHLDLLNCYNFTTTLSDNIFSKSRTCATR